MHISHVKHLSLFWAWHHEMDLLLPPSGTYAPGHGLPIAGESVARKGSLGVKRLPFQLLSVVCPPLLRREFIIMTHSSS